MEFKLTFKLTLSTLAGKSEANIIQFNTKSLNPPDYRDKDDNKIYKNDDKTPVVIYPSGRYVDVFTVVSSLNASMTYTLDIWINDKEITKNKPLKPVYSPNGTGIIDERITF
jgi:hypothetical protein